MFRSFIPSFEKPVAPPRYINVEAESRSFRGVGTVLLLAVLGGATFAFWEPSHQVTTPFVTASVPRSVPVATPTTAAAETTAAAQADAEDDQAAPTVKLSTLCSQRATARRDCASVKAFKDARLSAPEPEPEPAPVPAPAKESRPAAVAAKASGNGQPSAAPVAAQQVAAVTPSDVGTAQPDATQPAKTASAAKAKRPRPADEAPVERLVRVYDQVMPDGRRVPVYRRVGSGGYETGTIVDGEYRAVRGATFDRPRERYFGLQ